ncbi:hypothetical protein Tco_1244326 [Tanacetum coccineum]
MHEVVAREKAVVSEESSSFPDRSVQEEKKITDQEGDPRISSSLFQKELKGETEIAVLKSDNDQCEVDCLTVTFRNWIRIWKINAVSAGPNPGTWMVEFLATSLTQSSWKTWKLITDERVIDDKPESHSGSMSSMKNLDDTFNFGDQFLYDKPTEDDQEKSKVREESDSTIPDPSHQTVTSTPPVIAPFKNLRVARLEQEISEVKKTDHSADVLASIRSQVPTAVDNYLGTKLDDALLKVLERHTADLIEKYSVLPGPESVKNQESKKSPKEIIRAKKEQGEEKQDSTYSIRSTDKVDLEEFDLKSALFRHMNKIKLKTTRRKHDSDDDEDDDDDEGPSAGSNQGRSTKRRRSDAASGSAQPPPKDDDQSSKKPRESEASASKQHPALTSTGWQITDTREVMKGMTLIWRTVSLTFQGVDHYLVYKRFRKRETWATPETNEQEREAMQILMLEVSIQPCSEREYDISAVYGITHWWFRRKEFYINKHSESSDHEAVRSQMRILSVISGQEYYGSQKRDFRTLIQMILKSCSLLNIQVMLKPSAQDRQGDSIHTAVNMWIRTGDQNRVEDLKLGIEVIKTKDHLKS